MKRCRLFLLVALCLPLVQLAFAQTPTETASTLPRLVRFGGTVRGLNDSPLPGLAGITFALYSEQTGGAPLWMETQNVTADSNGHYTALLGSTKTEGLPADLFNSEQARWVGVQVQGQAEQPRVLLVSAPYALKAGDAETIGGLPPSAFVLAAPPAGGPAMPSGPAAMAARSSDVAPAAATDVTTTGGTADYLPIFNGAATIVDSVVFQSAASPFKIGINTATPATTLDVKGAGTIRGALSLPASGVATATAGAGSQPLNLVASAFNTTAAVNQTFRLQAEPVGNDTATPSGTLSLLYGSGTTAPAATGLTIASNGQITFANGQTFPGAGTITGITTAAGSGLTGGSTSGTPSLGLLTTCAANQVLAWNGSAWACATVGGGTGTVTSVATGTGLLGGPIFTAGTLTIDTLVVPQLGAATNTFTGNITAGNVNVTTGFQLQGYPFNSGTPNVGVGSGLGNALLGFAGNQKMTGAENVGVGWAALLNNTTGAANTAVGLGALQSNTQGVYNTAVGESALFANGIANPSNANGNTAVGYGAAYNNTGGYLNTAIGFSALYNNYTGDYNTAVGDDALNVSSPGNYNTAIGYSAGPSLTNLSNTTAIGNSALVGESNALVLGGTGANAVNVGIGTATPQYTLDVHGTGNFTGNVTFAPTQTFPGGGTISGVVAGTGLTGGGTSGSVTLNVNTALIPQLGAANTFTGNQNVNGEILASSSSLGVLGTSTAASGQSYGVGGLGQSPSGYGVWGLNDATSGGVGVYGSSASSAGYGVEGAITASSGGTGVYGTAPHFGIQGVATGGAGSIGVYGSGANGVQGSGTVHGVYGATTSPTGYGVYGVESATTGYTAGVYGVTSSVNGVGVIGSGTAAGSTGVLGAALTTGVSGLGTDAGSTGVYGDGVQYGLQGVATGSGSTVGVSGTGATGVQGTGTAYGVSGSATATGSAGVYGTGPGYGLYGYATGSGLGIHAYGGGSGGEFYGGTGASGANFQGGDDYGGYGGDGIIATGGNNGGVEAYAGSFEGNIYVSGSTESVRDELKIDHPLDPANKYLFHASVESSEAMNIYTGNVTTDDGGLATVQLPEWFEALNKDFRYQLTVIGQFAQAFVSSKVASHQFGIQTDKPNVEVSWQITGIRQDAYATAHPLLVEQEKDARERGHYIHPELYGAPEQQSIEWARHPEVMKRMQQNRARQLAAAQKPADTTPAGIQP